MHATTKETLAARLQVLESENDQLRDRLFSSLRDLERKSSALNRCAFINAHLLRAPVASLIGLIHLLDLKQASLDVEAREILSHLMHEAHRLDTVVHSITEAISESDGF